MSKPRIERTKYGFRNTDIDFTDALHIPYGGFTLISTQFSKRVLDMWVYVGVFGLVQWLLFAGLLGAAFLAILTIGQNDQAFLNNMALGVETVFMYSLQLGSHPRTDRLSKRLLFMTTSLLTFLIFVYYTTDVTAQMTFTRDAIQ